MLVVWELTTLSVEMCEGPDGPTSDELRPPVGLVDTGAVRELEDWAIPEPDGDKDETYVYEVCEWGCFEGEATTDELRVVVELVE